MKTISLKFDNETFYKLKELKFNFELKKNKNINWESFILQSLNIPQKRNSGKKRVL